MARLQERCKELQEQSKKHQEREQELEARLQVLKGPDSKVMEVIQGIEKQRDLYR